MGESRFITMVAGVLQQAHGALLPLVFKKKGGEYRDISGMGPSCFVRKLVEID